jgi:hypothetical protein
VSEREELDGFRAEGLAAGAREEFLRSTRATQRWEQGHRVDVDSILAWIGSLRALFGDPEVDRRPWQGDDFRL